MTDEIVIGKRKIQETEKETEKVKREEAYIDGEGYTEEIVTPLCTLCRIKRKYQINRLTSFSMKIDKALLFLEKGLLSVYDRYPLYSNACSSFCSAKIMAPFR